ncbi:MAG: YfiR family protein [Deltaproteobacteria bacterium]|nr:YfiR family protein [Deltaproteobacteria bacterium]
MRTSFRVACRVLVALLVAVVVGAVSPARAASVEPGQAALLMLKILAYDRNLDSRAGDAVTVLVVHRAGHRASEAVGAEMTRALQEASNSVTVANKPVRVLSAPYEDGTDVADVLRGSGATAVYLCPGLEGMLPAITTETQQMRALSVSQVEQYVDDGVAVGILSRGAKAQIVVNLPATKAEGVALSGTLLRLAEVRR